MSRDTVWALILAAGEGTRLSSLTTTAAGLTVPKQFCSLLGGPSLLDDTLARAAAVAQRQHTLTVVGSQHRRWWQAPLVSLPLTSVVVQPENKGTAVGLLLPLLHLVQRDPDAIVVVLPSDQFVRAESVLAQSLQHATRLARLDPQHVYLLGLVPERIDQELGYIVPERSRGFGAAAVRRFAEKPTADVARGLIGSGALWNAFILAASAGALLKLYARRHSGLTATMAGAVREDRLRPHDPVASERIYPGLATLDFSRDVLQGQEPALRVLTVPACGWNDLGTPERVAETLRRHAGRNSPQRGPARSAYLNLADQHARQQYTDGALALT